MEARTHSLVRVVQELRPKLEALKLSLECQKGLGPWKESAVLGMLKDNQEQAVRFLFGCFRCKLMRARLLFRASEHKFRSYKFHQHCNGVPHTLVLVRSEKGKTFGGYTPLPWKTPSEYAEYD